MRDAGNNKCGEHGKCENTMGSYKCACDSGWTGEICNCTIGMSSATAVVSSSSRTFRDIIYDS